MRERWIARLASCGRRFGVTISATGWGQYAFRCKNRGCKDCQAKNGSRAGRKVGLAASVTTETTTLAFVTLTFRKQTHLSQREAFELAYSILRGIRTDATQRHYWRQAFAGGIVGRHGIVGRGGVHAHLHLAILCRGDAEEAKTNCNKLVQLWKAYARSNKAFAAEAKHPCSDKAQDVKVISDCDAGQLATYAARTGAYAVPDGHESRPDVLWRQSREMKGLRTYALFGALCGNSKAPEREAVKCAWDTAKAEWLSLRPRIVTVQEVCGMIDKSDCFFRYPSAPAYDWEVQQFLQSRGLGIQDLREALSASASEQLVLFETVGDSYDHGDEPYPIA